MLGLDAAGKTTILYKICGKEVEVTIPTIGMNIETSDWMGEVLTVWDVGGRSPMRALYRHLFEDVDGFVYVIDSNDRDRMDQAKDELHRCLEIMDKVRADVPLLVFANKQDLPTAMTANAIPCALGLNQLKRPWYLQPCSAVGDKIDLLYGLSWLLDTVREPRIPALKPAAASAPEIPEQPVDKRSQPLQAVQSEIRTLERFAPIQRGTQCPFAKRARLWGAHIEDEDLIRHLGEFVRQSEADKELDGFVIELPNASTFSAFVDSVRLALTKLSDADPAGEGMMRKKYVGEVGWQFRFAGAPFFVTTFSPVYPSASPRFAFGAEAAFALLQPERGFVRRKLPLDDGTATGIRAAVRAAFAEHGRAFVAPAPRSANAHQIVRPLHEFEEHVRWWEEVESLTEASTISGSSDSDLDASLKTEKATGSRATLHSKVDRPGDYISRFVELFR
jgi:ADP-ribosylation factor protein 1